jgi:BolA protein
MTIADRAQVEADMARLLQSLNPTTLEIENESAKHHGHAGDDGSGATHFLVKIGGDFFSGKSRIDCHRLVYETLSPLIGNPIHALRIEVLR